MVQNARKNVESQILDTWSRGQSLIGYLFSDRGAVTRGGDSLDIPELSGFTVNTSESASIAASTFTGPQLVVNRPKFINQGVTQQQQTQLMNGGAAVAQVVRRGLADHQNAVDRDLIEYLFSLATVDDHFNLDLSATDVDGTVNKVEAAMREQDGCGMNPPLRWLGSPRASGFIKGASDYFPAQNNGADQGSLGMPNPGQLNDITYRTHSAMPGGATATRLQASITASAIASNVLTVTVGSDAASLFVVGQQVWTDGLTADVAVGSPSTITGISGGDITMALTSSNAADNGTGTLYSASAMVVLVNTDWLFYGDDGFPRSYSVKRDDNAGFAQQFFQYIGRIGRSGAVKILHVDDA